MYTCINKKWGFKLLIYFVHVFSTQPYTQRAGEQASFYCILPGDVEGINNPSRQLFQPSKPQNTQPSLAALTNALQASCADSAVFQLVNRLGDNVSEDANVAHTVDVHTSTVTALPQPLCGLAREFANADDFMGAIRYSDAEREIITENTVGQSGNDVWLKQRQGRITGSVMHSLFTRSKALAKQCVDTVPIVCRVMGYKTAPEYIPALKYGRETESVARRAYKAALESTGHMNVTVEETALHVHPDKGYLGASPDANVCCDCRGLGLVESKCPLSVANDKPDDTNLDYLCARDDGVHLKLTHPYNTQVQGQMAVCGRQWCDFFLYTKHDYHLERIVFNAEFWSVGVVHMELMFTQFVVPELLTGTIKSTLEVGSVATPPVRNKRIPTPGVTGGRKKQSRQVFTTENWPVYLCGTCSKMCVEVGDIANDCGNSIGCDVCGKCHHWGCVDYIHGQVSQTWHCKA